MVISFHKANKALKLYFRQLYYYTIYVFRSNKDYDHPTTLYECLEKPERRDSRSWLIITVPACCLCLLLARVGTSHVLKAVRDPIVEAVQRVQLSVMPVKIDVEENVTEISATVGYRGHQLRPTSDPPVTSSPLPPGLLAALPLNRKDMKGLLHRHFVSSADFVLGRLASERIKKRMKENRNVFTPVNLGIEEAVTSNPIESNHKLLPTCIIHRNTTATMKLNIALTLKNFENLSIPEDMYSMVRNGGYYKPADCSSRHKVAIIVPYRNQTKCLTAFLFNIHPFLINQNLEYRVFVIEQYGNRELNRGRLFNAGFKAAQQYGRWQCVVFHDVTLLPMSALILYTCPVLPRQMSTVILARNGTMLNATRDALTYGSVTAMTVQHFLAVNGYSNAYWGWNIQEHDLSLRLHHAKIRLVRYSRLISKYLLLPGESNLLNNTRVVLLLNAAERYKREGLNQLQYRVISTKHLHLHTHIIVDIDDDD